MKNFLLVFIFCVCYFSNTTAQVGLTVVEKPNKFLSQSFIPIIPIVLIEKQPNLPSQPLRSIIAASHTYDHHFGAFCKLELKLEQKTKVPVKFRLGSREYVDYMEGK